jgi:hypothetical protein
MIKKFKTYPLESISPGDALKKQWKLVDCLTKEFSGKEIITRGDLGVVPDFNEPLTTRKAEKSIASFFGTEDAILVRGSGTGAIRSALHVVINSGEKILIHKAPIYPTTKVSFDMLGIETLSVNFNELKTEKLPENIQAILIQFTRQKPDDSYSMAEVISALKSKYHDVPIITDDNYAVMKVPKIGVELGADLSCFSTFKLLGPEGVGCIVGKRKYIEIIRKENYSGGSQVQGHEALDVLRGLVYAPVALANQAKVVVELKKRLNNGEVPYVKKAYIANAQSKVLLVEFEHPIAQKLLKHVVKYGAAPNPIGAESKYEIVPMIYRVSGTFKEFDADLLNTTIRINPYRTGPDTIIRILKQSIKEVI